MPKDPNIQNQIKDEFERYADLLQGDFIDDYHNLTLKGVMAYKWLTEHCRNAELVLKVDDDISVDMFKMFNVYFPKYRLESMTIICNYIFKNTMEILRKNDSKWYVSNDHFRGFYTYPTEYCSGFLVLFTNDLIPALYQSSKVTPFFWVDDVYLYGLVPGNVPGVKYIGLQGNWFTLSGQVAIKCYKNETETCPFLVAGAGEKGEFEELWPHMAKRYALSTKVIDLNKK
jgi:beta-1,3-galactosyltransferase 1